MTLLLTSSPRWSFNSHPKKEHQILFLAPGTSTQCECSITPTISSNVYMTHRRNSKANTSSKEQTAIFQRLSSWLNLFSNLHSPFFSHSLSPPLPPCAFQFSPLFLFPTFDRNADECVRRCAQTRAGNNVVKRRQAPPTRASHPAVSLGLNSGFFF